jgi:hypothetical protein
MRVATTTKKTMTIRMTKVHIMFFNDSCYSFSLDFKEHGEGSEGDSDDGKVNTTICSV